MYTYLMNWQFKYISAFWFIKQTFTFTAWKMSKYGVFYGPYFPVFGLNTEICFVNSVQIQENTDQKKLRIWTLLTQWFILKLSICSALQPIKADILLHIFFIGNSIFLSGLWLLKLGNHLRSQVA